MSLGDRAGVSGGVVVAGFVALDGGDGDRGNGGDDRDENFVVHFGTPIFWFGDYHAACFPAASIPI